MPTAEIQRPVPAKAASGPMSYVQIKQYKTTTLDDAVACAAMAVRAMRRNGDAKPLCKAVARAVASNAKSPDPRERAAAVLAARRSWTPSGCIPPELGVLDYAVGVIENKTEPQKVIPIDWPLPDIIRRGECPVCRRWLDGLRDTDLCRFCGSRITW